MLDIEGIKKRVDDAEHYATCPKARNECKRCDDWFYSAMNVQAIIRTFVADIKTVMSSHDDASRERAMPRAELDRFGIKYREDTAELDELRTRHARIIDSAESFVAALVDERFKKDHASMLAELESLRAKDIESSKRMRADIDAMPSNVRAIFESARVDAKAKGMTILRALVDMVANSQAVQIERGITITDLMHRNENQSERIARDDDRTRELVAERNNLQAQLDASRNECREHLARINVLESHAASSDSVPMMLHCPMCHYRHIDAGEYATKPHHTHACQQCGTVWRPSIVATVGVQFLPGFKDAQPSHVLDKVQDNGECAHIVNRGSTLPINESTAHDAAKVEDKPEDASSANVVPDDVLQRAAGYANDKAGLSADVQDAMLVQRALAGKEPFNFWYNHIREFVRLWRKGQAPDAQSYIGTFQIGVKPIDASEPLCTCPPTSEYDDPCPKHGIVGMQFAKHPDVP